jgi:hypothetical protein
MVSLRYASESEFVSWKVLRMPCCRFGRCNDPEIEETTPLMMVRCSDGVAMGLRLMKE